MSEIGNLIENNGVSFDCIKKDEEINTIPNFKNIIFPDETNKFATFCYEYGWKNIFEYDKITDSFKIIPAPLHLDEYFRLCLIIFNCDF